jgi:hypothetical protein
MLNLFLKEFFQELAFYIFSAHPKLKIKSYNVVSLPVDWSRVEQKLTSLSRR